MSSSSSNVSSRFRTARDIPFLAHHSSPSREHIPIWVDACFFISTECRDFRRPRSCTRTASAPMSARKRTNETASSISESLMRVFTVT